MFEDVEATCAAVRKCNPVSQVRVKDGMV